MSAPRSNLAIGVLTLISALMLALHLFVVGGTLASTSTEIPMSWSMLLAVGPPLALGLCLWSAGALPERRAYLRINAVIALVHLWSWLAFGPIRLLDETIAVADRG